MSEEKVLVRDLVTEGRAIGSLIRKYHDDPWIFVIYYVGEHGVLGIRLNDEDRPLPSVSDFHMDSYVYLLENPNQRRLDFLENWKRIKSMFPWV